MIEPLRFTWYFATLLFCLLYLLSMLPDSLKSSLLRDISVLTQKTTEFIEFRFVSGGCINSAGKLETNSGSFFVKWNNANRFPGMFEAEQSGLSLLAADNLISIPSTITCGRSQDYTYWQWASVLVMRSEDVNSQQWEVLSTCKPHYRKRDQ